MSEIDRLYKGNTGYEVAMRTSKLHIWHENNPEAPPEKLEEIALELLADASHEVLIRMAHGYMMDACIHKFKLIEYTERWNNSLKASAAGYGKAKKLEPAKDEIKRIWSEGNFASRDICAEENYAALKFGSQKAARNALTNTPNPDPWPAKKSKAKPPRC